MAGREWRGLADNVYREPEPKHRTTQYLDERRWTCTCGAAARGYSSDREAAEGAAQHEMEEA